MWNDWLGSIPVYHTQVQNGRVASTLEPVPVASAGFTTDDFFLPGLVSLLLNGHFISDWTLYKNLKTIPADSVSQWGEKGFWTKPLESVVPSQDRWEAGWDDLVDEMHALAHKAIADVLKTRSTWILPLSAGLDSRLIAGVASDIGSEVRTYAWGASHATDVVYSRKLAKVCGFSWKHIPLPNDFLLKYTQPWANIYGTSMHFQGMYLMCFLDQLAKEPEGTTISGYLGDVLSGANLKYLAMLHAQKSYTTHFEWMSAWSADKLRTAARFPIDEALERNADCIREELDSYPGTWFQRLRHLQLRNRQRLFTAFLPTLMDYWRGTATPFIDRSFARFTLSLPRAALDDRRLLGDVFRRYYGKLSVIPGSYGSTPFILTGKYLIQRRIAKALPVTLFRSLLKGFGNIQIGVDFEPIQAHGKSSLWPLPDVWKQLGEWLDLQQIEADFQAVMKPSQDPRPLRRLQAAQTFSSALLPRINS